MQPRLGLSIIVCRTFPSPVILCTQCRFKRLPQLRRTSTDNSPKPPPSLPSTQTSKLAEKAAEYIDTLQLRALAATQRLNDITGYTSIESLKQQIEKQEETTKAARDALQNAKQAYSNAVTTRAETQRELTNLLNRKTSWTPDDLARFTTLYPTDHENEILVQKTAEELSLRERESEEASTELGRMILSRYHEEQIWSDKIRRASTWGTFALMGVNVLLFVVVQIGLEPWRRSRLVKGFEQKVQEAFDQIQKERDSTSIAIVGSVKEKDGEDVMEMVEIKPTQEQVGGQGEMAIATVEEVIEDEIDSQILGEMENEIEYIPDKKDLLIGAAGGAVLGALVTALGTWILSR